MKQKKLGVLIAGIGGASLGTEILKCLLLAGRYKVYGCDISNLAFGHYQEGFEKTFVVDRTSYTESILTICDKENINFIIPGGEEPMILLAESALKIEQQEIRLVANSPEVIKRLSDKKKCFETLSKLGFEIPLTVVITKSNDLDEMIFPCIVKPATGSGGSNFIFFALNKTEAVFYAKYLSNNGKIPLAQEYIPENEGEFTVGVLSLPNKKIACSIALKRVFNSKLSVFSKTENGLISSGYSQGLIDNFPEIRAIAEEIAIAVESIGPINIQGRVKNGTLVPFEINPRFSASTYLRAMAGINEPDIYLQYLSEGSLQKPQKIQTGYYLRSLSEVFVGKDGVKG